MARRQQAYLRAVLKELRSLEPVLLAASAAPQPAMNPANAALHAIVKEAGGKRWLILENGELKSRTEGEELLLIREGKTSISMPPLDGGGLSAHALARDLPSRIIVTGVTLTFSLQAT